MIKGLLKWLKEKPTQKNSGAFPIRIWRQGEPVPKYLSGTSDNEDDTALV